MYVTPSPTNLPLGAHKAEPDMFQGVSAAAQGDPAYGNDFESCA